MKKIDLNLKQRFLDFRNNLGLTQQETSELFGVSLQTWQRWEYGISRPNGAVLKLLAHYEISPPEKIPVSQMCETIRQHLALTKGGMAKILGVDPDSWGCWERGVMKPSHQFIEKIKQMYKEITEQEPLQKAS